MRKNRQNTWWIYFTLPALILVGLYFVTFGYIGWFSNNSEEWARFGEYVGGAFGMLAFAGVLYTVELQRRQLSQLSEQATVDELHRLCREMASNIDGNLDGPILVNEQRLSKTLRGVLEEVANEAFPNQSLLPTIVNNQFGSFIKVPIGLASFELDQLADTLRDSAMRGGSIVILDYYRARYGEVVRRIRRLEYPLRSAEFWLEAKQETAR